MKFFLDALYITLIIFCVVLLFRLIRNRLMHKHRSPLLHPVLLPIEYSPEDVRQITIQYELPHDSHVNIQLVDVNENQIEQYLDKDQKSGNYFIKKQLPEGEGFFLLFRSVDAKIMRRIILPTA